MKEQIFTAHDGKKLVCTLWDNVTQPIGVVQIIHGMDEHVRRYDRFAKFLNRNGYIVFGDDHRAHGKTATSIERIGKPDGDEDLFAATVADELEIIEYLKNKYHLPVFLFGHSYGSFITQAIMEKTNLCTAGVCLSGTARYPGWALNIARAIAWIGRTVWGPAAPARFIETFSPIRGPGRLTRDRAQTAKHNADPMRTKYFSYGFYYSLFSNLIKLRGNIAAETPLLIISGSRDLVSLNSRLSMALYREYQEHGLQNLTIIIYPSARHELLMEINYKDVQNDILEFFNSINPNAYAN